ncbi:MAG: cytochrome c oxidase subunit II [Acidimicrobiales bacterium]
MDSSLTSPSADSPQSTPQNPPAGRRSRWLAAAVVVGTGLLFAGCKVPTFGEYSGATTQGRSELHLWQLFFIAGLVVGGFVFLLILWAVFRYRRRSDEMPKQTQYHTLLEVTYTVVPILIVVGLFVFTVLAENKVDATPPRPTATIHVFAFQWGWEFSYPGGVKVIGQTTQDPTMVIPTGTDVQIDLKSLDVLHGFYVPEFNFSRYASPGYTTYFDFDALHTGDFRGQCTQLCGLYHSLMFFNVRAVTQAQYATWLHTAQALVKAKPSSVPKLPSGVGGGTASTNSRSNDPGSDLYGD